MTNPSPITIKLKGGPLDGRRVLAHPAFAEEQISYGIPTRTLGYYKRSTRRGNTHYYKWLPKEEKE